MESGTYFLQGSVDVSWMCRQAGPSGSLPQWVNTSTTGSVLCKNGSIGSSSWSPQVNRTDYDVDEDMPRFNQLSLVKTVTLSAAGQSLVKLVTVSTGQSVIKLVICHWSRRSFCW